jgi:ubiquinone/menaquinone biosynthesis C-methylase UbiE
MRFQNHLIDHEENELAALRSTGILDGARVLEVGCGDGRLTLGYAPLTRSVLGIDPDAEAIAKARETLPDELAGRVRFETGSAMELSQPPGSFDVCLLSHSL